MFKRIKYLQLAITRICNAIIKLALDLDKLISALERVAIALEDTEFHYVSNDVQTGHDLDTRGKTDKTKHQMVTDWLVTQEYQDMTVREAHALIREEFEVSRGVVGNAMKELRQ